MAQGELKKIDVSMVFPGQGSQHTGMGKFLYENFPFTRDLFEEASDSISVDLKKVCFEGADSDLILTKNAQPCLVLVSSITHEVFRRHYGVQFAALSGHSVGEYSALVAARVMKFADAIRAVRARGEIMQEAVPVGEGGMVATIGLDGRAAEEFCKWVVETSGFSPLEPANYNAPGQIVISGSQKAINWALENYKSPSVPASCSKLKLIPLKVSAPFHCSLMAAAEEKMRMKLDEIHFDDAESPVVQNYTGLATSIGHQIKENLVRQLAGAVRWIDCVNTLSQSQIKNVIEAAPGKVLSGLIKKINPQLAVTNINSLEEVKTAELLLRSAHVL